MIRVVATALLPAAIVEFERGQRMANATTRRDVLKGSLAMAGLSVVGLPEWAIPALAQGETLMEFTDLPDEINLIRDAERRIIDVRHIDGPILLIKTSWGGKSLHYDFRPPSAGTYTLSEKEKASDKAAEIKKNAGLNYRMMH